MANESDRLQKLAADKLHYAIEMGRRLSEAKALFDDYAVHTPEQEKRLEQLASEINHYNGLSKQAEREAKSLRMRMMNLKRKQARDAIRAEGQT